MSKVHIEYVPVSSLSAATYNPRKWDEAAAEKLKQSITKFGLVDPFIVNKAKGRENIIIGGHFRWNMAKELGFAEVPVVFVNIPDIEKEKELNLRLNRNIGEWDFELLKSFDIDLLMDIGFSDQDISDIWDDVLQIEDDEFNTKEELEKIKTPKTKPGDLYALGKHRLLCGDSTKGVDVERLMGKETAKMVYSDPPFNIALDYDKGLGGKKKYGGTKTDDSRTDAEYRKFLKKTMENALKASGKDLHMFYWCDESYIGLVQGLFAELELTNRRVCLWIKNNQNVTPQIAFNKVYEPCVYSTRGSPYLQTESTNFHEVLNKEVDTGNRLIEDIMDLFNIWLIKRLPTNEYKHPTEKPITLHEKPLRRCTRPGDLVFDLFGGSGSTLIACEQMKRRCFTVELEPIFCDLIIARYEHLTGTKARKLR